MPDENNANPAARTQPPDRDGLVEQSLRYLAGDLPDEGVAALGRKLRDDPAAGDLFVKICLLDSWLREKFVPGRREFLSEVMMDESEDSRSTTSFDTMILPALRQQSGWADDGPAPIELPPLVWPPPKPMVYDPWPRRMYAAAAALAAMILLTTLLIVLLPRNAGPVADKRPASPMQRLADSSVPTNASASRPTMTAVLAGAVGAKWAAPHNAPQVGQRLTSEPLELTSGLAEVRFANGASLVIEAPARVELRSDMRAALVAGKLVAMVPPPASGFAVETSAARLVDLGTEFGVEVEHGETTRVEVFRGKVLANPPVLAAEPSRTSIPVTQPSPSFQSRELVAGEAGRVTPGAAAVAKANTAPLSFVRGDEFDAHQAAAAASASRYQRWLAYTYQLRRDPDVVAYYIFEARSATEAPRVLPNQTAAGAALDGTLTGKDAAKPTWVPGRFPQKQALHFGGDAGGVSRVEFPVGANGVDFNRGGESFTVAAWVKFDVEPEKDVARDRSAGFLAGFGHRGVLTRVVEKYERMTISAEVKGNIGAGLGLDAPVTAVGKRYSVINSNRKAATSWQHVAVTYDQAAGQVMFFVNGEKTGEGAAKADPNKAFGLVGLGCRLNIEGEYHDSMEGVVDELVFARRAMTEAEIKSMYEAGKPE